MRIWLLTADKALLIELTLTLNCQFPNYYNSSICLSLSLINIPGHYLIVQIRIIFCNMLTRF
jgi:hypothetical protein